LKLNWADEISTAPARRRRTSGGGTLLRTQVPGLGRDFIQEVRAAVLRINQWPDAWQPLDAEIRRCRTHRFPYGVIYSIEQGQVLILSVMHLHRHPDSWRKNLP